VANAGHMEKQEMEVETENRTGKRNENATS